MSPLESRGHRAQLQPTALFSAAFCCAALGQNRFLKVAYGIPGVKQKTASRRRLPLCEM